MADVTFPHIFADGPGNVASGEQVMDNLNAVAGIVNNLDLDNLSTVVQSMMFKAGDLKWTAKTGVPDTGWLLCDGAAVSQVTYAALFAAIGTTYGAGAGTFSLPDLRARVPVGVGTAAGVTAVGQSDGLAVGSRGAVHAHTTPAHTHAHVYPIFASFGANIAVGDTSNLDGYGSTVSYLFDTTPSAPMQVLSPDGTATAFAGVTQNSAFSRSKVTSSPASPTTNGTTNAPYIVLNAWIRT